MSVTLGDTVVYDVHLGHRSMHPETEFAAIVGRVNADGSADLVVFPPNREPRWVDKVPQGTGPHTFRPKTPTAA